MLEDDQALKEAVNLWKNSNDNQRDSREELITLLKTKLKTYNISQLSSMTGIKRPTLYFMLYGRGGKGGRIDDS